LDNSTSQPINTGSSAALTWFVRGRLITFLGGLRWLVRFLAGFIGLSRAFGEGSSSVVEVSRHPIELSRGYVEVWRGLVELSRCVVEVSRSVVKLSKFAVRVSSGLKFLMVGSGNVSSWFTVLSKKKLAI